MYKCFYLFNETCETYAMTRARISHFIFLYNYVYYIVIQKNNVFVINLFFIYLYF